MRLDADDYLKDALEKFFKAINQDQEIVVYSDFYIVDNNLKIIRRKENKFKKIRTSRYPLMEHVALLEKIIL